MSHGHYQAVLILSLVSCGLSLCFRETKLHHCRSGQPLANEVLTRARGSLTPTWRCCAPRIVTGLEDSDLKEATENHVITISNSTPITSKRTLAPGSKTEGESEVKYNCVIILKVLSI